MIYNFRKMLVVGIVFFVVSLSTTNVFAEADAGSKVKIIIPDNKMPPAGFEVLLEDVQFASDINSCIAWHSFIIPQYL